MSSIKSTKLYRRAHAVAGSMAALAPDAFYAYKGRTIERFVLFAGYARSGSTLVGVLLNAHPEMVVSHEAEVLSHVSPGRSKGGIVRLILSRDRKVRKNSYKNMSGGYAYGVKNQWQGKYSRLRVIGDKDAGRSAEIMHAQPGLLDALRSRMGIPVRVLFTCRNPYDMIATGFLRRLQREENRAETPLSGFTSADAEKPELVQEVISWFLRRSTKLVKVLSLFPEDEIFSIRHEDFIASPRDKLREICTSLGVECTEDYLTDCAAIVYSSPRQTRFKVQWTCKQIEEVAAAVKKHPWFEGYTFDA